VYTHLAALPASIRINQPTNHSTMSYNLPPISTLSAALGQDDQHQHQQQLQIAPEIIQIINSRNLPNETEHINNGQQTVIIK
jgi:CRISPR/Cas system-associated protein Cas5 (RAMP superfamily)